jgi:hypothetical protein
MITVRTYTILIAKKKITAEVLIATIADLKAALVKMIIATLM